LRQETVLELHLWEKFVLRTVGRGISFATGVWTERIFWKFLLFFNISKTGKMGFFAEKLPFLDGTMRMDILYGKIIA
jgi:hypothetical protein